MSSIEGIIDVTPRLEGEGDRAEVENLVREAFWDVYKPGCDEHLVLHQLRKALAFVRELDFVACADGQIIGHIVYSKAQIVNHAQERFEVLCMGPIGKSSTG